MRQRCSDEIKKYPLRNKLQLDQHQKGDSVVPGVKYYGDNIYREYQMVNPHQQSQYEKSNYISLGRYQPKGNGTDGFNRGCDCEHDVNHLNIMEIISMGKCFKWNLWSSWVQCKTM